jgi:hypothetical protein
MATPPAITKLLRLSHQATTYSSRLYHPPTTFSQPPLHLITIKLPLLPATIPLKPSTTILSITSLTIARYMSLREELNRLLSIHRNQHNK